MTSHNSDESLESKLGRDPQMKYLSRFIENGQWGNNACDDRQTLSRYVVVLDRFGGRSWTRRTSATLSEPNSNFWSALPHSDGQAIILDYLDPEAIKGLMAEFSLPPEFFKSHLGSSEQHFAGWWAPSDLTTAPCLRSAGQAGGFFSVGYRRPYDILDGSDVEVFDHARRQRCSLLRSFHKTDGSPVLFQHEMYSVAWFAGNSRRPGWCQQIVGKIGKG